MLPASSADTVMENAEPARDEDGETIMKCVAGADATVAVAVPKAELLDPRVLFTVTVNV